MAKTRLARPYRKATARLDALRQTEYAYLDEQDHVYLDYTGAGLAARRQYESHKDRLEGTTFGNPHSESPTSRVATDMVKATRMKVLNYFKASPDEYQVVFTPNATGAAKLVGESYPFRKHSRLILSYDNHNSVNGLREYARRAASHTAYVPMRKDDLRIDTSAIIKTFDRIEGRSIGWPFCSSSHQTK